MTDIQVQQEKATRFRNLHHTGRLLTLPNIWNPLGAAMLEDLGYQAVATASASVALTNGYQDGENIPFENLLEILKSIAKSVNIPVTADIESGYASTKDQLSHNIERLIETGIVGINIEDSDKQTGKLYSIEAQCQRIELIRTVASQMSVPLFINARTDIYVKTDGLAPEEKFHQTVERARAYRDAGADCFFPILMKEKEDLQNIVSAVSLPVNVVALPGLPNLKSLEEMGIARLSLGPAFLKESIRAMKAMAANLLQYEGFDAVTGNPVTSDYLKQLVNKKIYK
ncbi:MAG TPA: isocitrate lyase/phosphoenolpyruvate mutase family protein [Chitinophagaceae bacterium]